jgi:hypothetical protein
VCLCLERKENWGYVWVKWSGRSSEFVHPPTGSDRSQYLSDPRCKVSWESSVSLLIIHLSSVPDTMFCDKSRRPILMCCRDINTTMFIEGKITFKTLIFFYF